MLVIPIVTSVGQLGVYALALAITAPVQLGLSMNMRSVRVVEPDDSYQTRDFFALATAAGLVAMVISTIIGTVFLEHFDSLLVVLIVASTKAIESLVEVCYGDLQRWGRLDLVAESQIARSILNAATVTCALLAFGELWIAALGLLTVALGSLFVALLWRRRSGTSARTASLSRVGALARAIWPLGISACITSLNGALPRLIAFPVLGDTAAGYLALLTYPATVLSLVGNSLGQAYLVRFRHARAAGGVPHLRRIARTPLSVVAAMGIGVTALAGLTIFAFPDQLIVPEEFLAVAPLFCISATLAALSAVAFHLQTSSGIYKFHPILSGATCMAALVSLVPLSFLFDIMGIGIAMILYYMFQFAAWMFVALRSGSPRQHVSNGADASLA